MSLRLLTISALFAAARVVSATDQGVEKNATSPVLGTDTVHGCYKSKGSMVLNGTIAFNSQGSCNTACRGIQMSVGATQASKCYCGDQYPPLNLLTTDDKCAEPCPGYGPEACGGLNTWTVYNTGLIVQVADDANVTDTSTSGSGGADATSTEPASAAASTVIITPSAAAGGSSSGTSTVGIAVGVVVGILAVAGIGGGIFFFMRRRRNADIEEEHRRNAAVNAFISGGKPPSSSGGLSISDQRLDPVMAQRRMSSGSIADDQDYSRRILRVTNA